MGCGCGGNRRVVSRSTAPSQALQAGASARAQIQSNQRQALIQKARERIQQANGVQQQASGLSAQQRNLEQKRRIQVTLKNKNGRIQET